MECTEIQTVLSLRPQIPRFGPIGTPNGQSQGHEYNALLFGADVESGIRSLSELFRCMGMMRANFPKLNAVLGIKCEDDASDRDKKMHALILIERRTTVADGTRAPQVTKLIDFGPYEYPKTRKDDANAVLHLPLPRLLPQHRLLERNMELALSITAAHLPPSWTRMVSGREDAGDAGKTDHVVEIRTG
jgi:hypothetical protein